MLILLLGSLLLTAAVAFITYKLISKAMEKRRIAFEERIEDPSQREEALAEMQAGLEKTKRHLWIYHRSHLLAGSLFALIGATGVYYLGQKMLTGKIGSILDEYGGEFYFISPLLLILGILYVKGAIHKIRKEK